MIKDSTASEQNLEQDNLEEHKDQDKIVITKRKMMKVLRNILNWKASGPDNIQGYWLKKLVSLHDNLMVYLQHCLDSRMILKWLKKEHTVLM